MATVVIAALALAAPAQAKYRQLVGSAKGDSNSKLTLTVRVSDEGEPKRIKSLRYTNVDLFKGGGAGAPCDEVSGKFDKLSFATGDEPGTFLFQGTDNRKLHRVYGLMEPYPKVNRASGQLSFEQPGGGLCGSETFKLKN